MSALLLGGAGFIGQHLARRLVDDGHQVSIVDNLSQGHDDSELAALREAPGVEVIHGDITDAGTYAALPHKWDQVYLLAAIVAVRNVEADPARLVHTNTLAALHLMDWVEPGERVFFASTSEVHAGGVDLGMVPVDTADDVPVVISNVGAPRYSYAMSKLLGEAAVVHVAPAKDCTAVVGRFHNVYGPRMGADHVIPELALRALRGEDPFLVYGTEQTRAFCYVDDAVEAMVRVMDSGAAGIVHIGDDTEETTIGDLAKLVLRTAGISPTINPAPAPPGAVARRCPDLSRLRALTGYEPAVPLEEGVRRTFDWYREWWPR